MWEKGNQVKCGCRLCSKAGKDISGLRAWEGHRQTDDVTGHCRFHWALRGFRAKAERKHIWSFLMELVFTKIHSYREIEFFFFFFSASLQRERKSLFLGHSGATTPEGTGAKELHFLHNVELWGLWDTRAAVPLWGWGEELFQTENTNYRSFLLLWYFDTVGKGEHFLKSWKLESGAGKYCVCKASLGYIVKLSSRKAKGVGRTQQLSLLSVLSIWWWCGTHGITKRKGATC